MAANSVKTKEKIEVLLMGQRFTVRSDRDEAYLDHLSQIVNSQVEEIKTHTSTASTQNLALLAALNIADQLARTKESLSLAEERLFFEKKEFEEMKEELTRKARATLQEVESALSYLPNHQNKEDEHSDKGHEGGFEGHHTYTNTRS